MIRIASKKDGFRRCGRSFSAKPIEYHEAEFRADEMEILQAEPMLTVEVVEDSKGLSLAEKAAQIQAAATLDELDKLAEGEANKGLLKAIVTRRKELTPGA